MSHLPRSWVTVKPGSRVFRLYWMLRLAPGTRRGGPVTLIFPMRLDELDYVLPPDLIAQRPLPQRDSSRLLAVARNSGTVEDHAFSEFPNLLRGDELLVLNNARVIPARLIGHRVGVHSQAPSKATRREHLTGDVEVLL